MFIRKLASLAAIAAVGLMVFGAVSASAGTTLRTDPGGGLLSGSTTIRNTTADPATLSTLAGEITCHQTFFDADVNVHSSTTDITGKLTTLTFTSCTDNILAVNILDCTLGNAPLPSVTITARAGGLSTISLGDTTVRCATSTPGKACYYTAPFADGSGVNATSSIAYTNVGVSGITTGFTDGIVPVNCGTSGQFGVTLTHIVQGTGSDTVTIATS